MNTSPSPRILPRLLALTAQVKAQAQANSDRLAEIQTEIEQARQRETELRNKQNETNDRLKGIQNDNLPSP